MTERFDGYREIVVLRLNESFLVATLEEVDFFLSRGPSKGAVSAGKSAESADCFDMPFC